MFHARWADPGILKGASLNNVCGVHILGFGRGDNFLDDFRIAPPGLPLKNVLSPLIMPMFTLF